MYLVVECQVMSAPSSIGRCKYGEQNVLSTATSWPGVRIAAMAAMSITVKSGLVGVSTQKSFVAGVTAARTASRSFMSTNVVVMP
jgi:hypothetical protein